MISEHLIETLNSVYYAGLSVSLFVCIFPLAIHRQVLFVALECVNAGNFVLYAPEQYYVACSKVCPVADLK